MPDLHAAAISIWSLQGIEFGEVSWGRVRKPMQELGKMPGSFLFFFFIFVSFFGSWLALCSFRFPVSHAGLTRLSR
jgi:hypothetical protein